MTWWWCIAGILLLVMFVGILVLASNQRKKDDACTRCQQAPWFNKDMCKTCIKNTQAVEDLLER